MQCNIRRGHFQPALKALDLIGIRFHDFRHFFVVLHVVARTHPKLVQARIGYDNISRTIRYAQRMEFLRTTEPISETKD